MLQVAIVLDVRDPNLPSKNILQEICVNPDGAAAPGFLVPRRLRLGPNPPTSAFRRCTPGRFGHCAASSGRRILHGHDSQPNDFIK
jgi:hypothetical protein